MWNLSNNGHELLACCLLGAAALVMAVTSILIYHTHGKVLKYRIERLQEALGPFAAMHREGSDPLEVACSRGVASDLTIFVSADFAYADKVLNRGS